MKLGIVGLPNVGKSTLFNSLTKAGAESANYPFCTIDPNVGVVTVPDERLNVLGEMYHTKKIIPAAIEFVDIAGLVKGASKGEGLGNQFLANIREVDAIVHVVRCFENSNIVHVDGSINPLRDIETINLELIFSDLEILERRISKVSKVARNDKSAAKELTLLNKIKAHLEDGKLAKTFEEADDEEEQAWLESYNLLTYNRLSMRRMYLKMILQMMRPITKVYRLSVNMQKVSRAKFSLYVQRLRQRFQNWMMMKRKCSWRILD